MGSSFGDDLGSAFEEYVLAMVGGVMHVGAAGTDFVG